MAAKVVQAVHQAQQRAEAAMAVAEMVEDIAAAPMRISQHLAVPVLAIFLTIPVLDSPVVEAAGEVVPAMVLLMQ